MTGFVSLVGAGPGDPELLTMRAVDRLRRADIVFYDALIDERTLDFAPQARKFFVGKRAGRKSIGQRTIERLLVAAARRGQRVVRLKCGDPFIFGRGGEEALALGAHGVPFEIVPGLSSALAAPASFGIPLTHRGVANAFVVVSGHDERAFEPVVRTLAPGAATLVVLMGLGNRARLVSQLLERGWQADTPAAVVLDATHPEAALWRGALGELPHAVWASAEPAGIIVLGEVTRLAERLALDVDGTRKELATG